MTKIKKFETHLFICVKCGEKDMTNPNSLGHSLRKQIKEWIDSDHPEWKGKVRISGSGCLGQCDYGVAAVCYPKTEWLVELKENDLDRLKHVLTEAMKS